MWIYVPFLCMPRLSLLLAFVEGNKIWKFCFKKYCFQETAEDVFVPPLWDLKNMFFIYLFIFFQTAAQAAQFVFFVATCQHAAHKNHLVRWETFDLDIDSAHDRAAWCRARPASIREWWPRRYQVDPWSRGRELLPAASYSLLPHLKNTYFLPFETDREILSSVLCASVANCILRNAWPAPATYHRHGVKTVTLGWVGAP